jgi:hypothetical protein
MKYILLIMLGTTGQNWEPRGVASAEFDDLAACEAAATKFQARITADTPPRAGIIGICMPKGTSQK